MKLEIIQHKDYLLAVDKEANINDGDWFMRIPDSSSWVYGLQRTGKNEVVFGYPKVIAALPLNGAKPLERVYLLPELETLDYEFDRKFMFPKISPIIERLRKTDYEAFLDIGRKLYDTCFDFYKEAGGQNKLPIAFELSQDLSTFAIGDTLKGNYIYE